MERNLTHRIGTATAILVFVLAVVVLFAGPASAQSRVVTVSDETKHAGEFVVPINKSQILQMDVPFSDLLVGNAEIADVLALTDRSIYVLGKALGSTSLTIYGRNRSLIAVMDLVVTYDINGLKTRLFELLPDESIEVRPLNASIVLSGTVSSATKMKRAATVAAQFTGDEERVVNMMSVKGSQQVLLAVRFSEMTRSASKDIGLSSALVGDDFAIVTGASPGSDLAFGTSLPGTGVALTGTLATFTGFASGVTTFGLGNGTGLALAFDALESKGLSKTLAEPNLIALSGETASFLAGGEFPIPVASEDGITVTFKEFGVSLSFTPTVLDDGLINLVVSPEVSSVDRTLVVNLGAGDSDIPGISTRRATTTVELRDGQSFAIAGLLQDDFSDNIEQFPFLGDLPILGALFRSTDFQRNETELVILVTPHLVQPAPAGALATPTDNFIPPSDANLFLMGRMEDPQSGIGPLGGGGGIDGSYGHIIK